MDFPHLDYPYVGGRAQVGRKPLFWRFSHTIISIPLLSTSGFSVSGQYNKAVGTVPAASSFYFLFKVMKLFSIEKFLNGDTESITQLFDGRDRRATVTATDDIVHRGLRDAADVA